MKLVIQIPRLNERDQLAATIADLNRRLLEEMLGRVRRLDADLAARAWSSGEPIEGVLSTGQPPWREERDESAASGPRAAQ